MTKLNVLDEKKWKNISDIIMFGYGRQGRKMYSTLKHDFQIKAIVENDRNKIGLCIDGLIISSLKDVKELLGKCKVIVTTSEYYYLEIKKQLELEGLVENIDFIMYQQFIMEWYYKFKEKINVIKTDLILTSYCNLNCKNCMEFLPYWKKKYETSLESCMENLDYYFQCVDYVMEMDLIGGEPFLYSRLPELITYIGEQYRDRIGYLGFITNGLVIPKDEVLYLLRKYGITISISDYSKILHYEEKMDLLCTKLDEIGVSYFRNENIDWFDFGFPKDVYHYSEDEAKRHMDLCNTIEHLLDDKKIYYCGLAWAAQKGELFPEDKNSYIDLCNLCGKSLEDRKIILEMLLGNIEGGYVQFCKVCGGFGIDNNNKVKTAEQYKR